MTFFSVGTNWIVSLVSLAKFQNEKSPCRVQVFVESKPTPQYLNSNSHLLSGIESQM